MQVVKEFWGIFRSAAKINAYAVSLSSWQAFLSSCQISYCPLVLVSQNSSRHFCRACLDKGVSYAGVFLIPSPVVWFYKILSTLWFCKYWIRSPVWEPPAPPTAPPYDGLDPLGLLATFRGGLFASLNCGPGTFPLFCWPLFPSLEVMQQPIAFSP